MSRAYEELDVQPTSMGELILRRRRVLSLGKDVHEVLLDGRFLMSSLVTDSERALARLALVGPAAPTPDAPAGGPPGNPHDAAGPAVLVGGLGLGYTAAAALEYGATRVTVLEALPPVIDWHRRGLVPLGAALGDDPRCRLVHADFFAAVAAAPGVSSTATSTGSPPDALDPAGYHAILVDIDHSPSARLAPSHAAFYEPDALGRLAAWLRPGGAFAFWSADLPEPWFVERLQAVFDDVRAEVVEFENPLADVTEGNTIYLSRRRD